MTGQLLPTMQSCGGKNFIYTGVGAINTFGLISTQQMKSYYFNILELSILWKLFSFSYSESVEHENIKTFNLIKMSEYTTRLKSL